jgi:hypothetical protein
MIKRFLAVILIALPVVSLSCKKIEVTSVKRDWDISIDGNDSEWPDTCIKYLERPGQSVCFANDGTHLFLLFRVSDPRVIMQIIGQGATIWFEPEGGSRLGIHYPMGLGQNKPDVLSVGERRPRDAQRGPSGKFAADREIAVDPELIERAKKEMEILVPDKSIKQLVMAAVSKSYGLDVKLAFAEESLVYELKIPLNRLPEGDFSLNAGSSDKIYVTILGEESTTKSGSSQTQGPPDFGEAPEGMPTSGRMMSQGKVSGMGSVPGRDKTEKLEFKFLVKLSK